MFCPQHVLPSELCLLFGDGKFHAEACREAKQKRFATSSLEPKESSHQPENITLPMMQLPTNIHGLGNAIEAVVWWILGASLLVAAYRKPLHRRRCLVVAIALLLFGCSDIVEIDTGAWWRPWWLLVWKAACLATLLHQWLQHRKRTP